MSKTFTYTRVTESGSLEGSDENEEWGEDFEYCASTNEIRTALVYLLYDNYFKDLNLSKEQKIKLKDKIFEVICDNDLDDSLADCYEDELYEYFREFAFEE